MVSYIIATFVRLQKQRANDIASRTQLRCGVQHGHDSVRRRDEVYVGGHQEDKAYFCEAVIHLMYFMVVVLRGDSKI
jgi:hypothetical protein